MKRLIFFPVLLLTAMLSGGCATFSTFQSPEALPSGETTLGFGVLGAGVGGETGLAELSLLARTGLGSRFDGGVKFFGFPLVGGIQVDLKHQITPGPFLVSVDLGISYVGTKNSSTVGFYPMILVGNRRIYAGVKQIILTSDFESDYTFLNGTYKASLTGVMVGASFGESAKFMPEVAVYFGESPAFFFGAGFHFPL